MRVGVKEQISGSKETKEREMLMYVQGLSYSSEDDNEGILRVSFGYVWI